MARRTPRLKVAIAVKAHGHVVIFEIDDSAKSIYVVHVFHTRQDWQNKLYLALAMELGFGRLRAGQHGKTLT